MSDVSIKKLAAVYFKIREAKAANTREYEARDKELAEQLSVVSNEMLRQMHERGVSSEKIDGLGTIYIHKAVRATIADDAAFFGWVRDKDCIGDALERRVKSTFIQSYMENNDGVAPPGLSIFTEMTARMRKARDSQ